MQPAELECRLDEWKRWALAGRHHRGQAGKAEGNFRSPQRDHWTEPVSSLRMRPIAWRAYEVECAVTTMLDPFR